MENVIFTDLKQVSRPIACEETPLEIVMKNVSASFLGSPELKPPFLTDSYTTLVTE